MSYANNAYPTGEPDENHLPAPAPIFAQWSGRTTPVTFDEVTALLATYNRDAVNPTGLAKEGRADLCLYTAQDDPTRHCIAGQLLTDLGLFCPGPTTNKNFGALVVDRGMMSDFAPDVADAIAELQSIADSPDPHLPGPWGKAIDAWPALVELYRTECIGQEPS